MVKESNPHQLEGPVVNGYLTCLLKQGIPVPDAHNGLIYTAKYMIDAVQTRYLLLGHPYIRYVNPEFQYQGRAIDISKGIVVHVIHPGRTGSGPLPLLRDICL
ncbi:hypothetical protein MBAV_004011 [Candidatus Magnetobacterium bavaricum]|uniref:Uncharacterized protein n=1 Tax=Candidatus Magnetobacterium bavaricum TaxID=29290 RepID=A0A0F3GPA9_9BACT|nr:hypothetical protein MBAV_004011 [Candidatus Magnetobacterium bavaricum]